MDGIKNTERKFKEFQQAYDKLLTGCLTSALAGMSGGDVEPVETLQEKYGKPRGSDLEEAAFRLSECRSIVFIVGAGVSVESGVPTYKGNDEKWEIDGKCYSGQMMTHEEMATSNIMMSYPLEFWQKQHYTLMNMARCRPNRTHYAIAELYNYWRHIGRTAAVITQNIDNYDREVLGPDAEVYEVHGNLTYMRCMTGCCDVLFPAPETDEPIDRIPMCPSCEGLARPHILLFDESYEEKWYKSTSAEQAAANADCILVLGTQLKTGLANRVVREACKRPNTLVIEVNVEPVIAYGQVLVFSSTCGDVVPSLVSMAVQQAG
jgi:NAD-dependent deacetylase